MIFASLQPIRRLVFAGRSAAPDPGARYTQYNIRYNPAGSPNTRLESTKDDVTPYAGLVYDINEDWSTYVSYTLSSSRRISAMSADVILTLPRVKATKPGGEGGLV